MIPPAGFKAEMYPLRHRFNYAVGLQGATAAENSTILTLVKNYKGSIAAQSIFVNPHHGSLDVETGAICGKMSIIDKLKLSLTFSLTKNATTTDKIAGLKCLWMPIFFSFPEKLDAVDDVSTTSVASILSLTKDATQEDITPAFAGKLDTTGPSDTTHPISTVNLVSETLTILNLTTDLTMEGVPWNQTTFLKALKYYTNKGALKACVGRTRNFTLTENHRVQSFFINKFVPKPIRRIVPYTYFGILLHMPLGSDIEQHYTESNLNSTLPHIGVKAHITYDEWNPEHNQEMEATA